MLKLVSEVDPILKRKCPLFDFSVAPTSFDSAQDYLINLTNHMFPFMWMSEGVGLAAPQIGLSLRLFVMSIDGEDIVCINPEILENSDECAIFSEGCLSFPDLTLNIKRPEWIYVSYQGLDGVVVRRNLNGMASCCFQHELDHLNGITFDSKVAKLSLQLAQRKRKQLSKQKLRRSD